MICKYCGNKIDPGNNKCENCGRRIMLDGGNGFWDMASVPADSTQHNNFNLTSEKTTASLSGKTNEKKGNALPVILSAVCFALCVASIALSVYFFQSSSDRIQTLANKFDNKILELEQLNDTNAQLLESINSKFNPLEDRIQNLENPQSPVVRITTPSTVMKPLGYISHRDEEGIEWLFDFTIKGKALLFEWEKKIDDGSWESLVFDRYSDYTSKYNVVAKYGLAIEESVADGYSRIGAVGLTPESEGVYQCTVITVHGKDTVQVELIIEDEHEDNPGNSQESSAVEETNEVSNPEATDQQSIKNSLGQDPYQMSNDEEFLNMG